MKLPEVIPVSSYHGPRVACYRFRIYRVERQTPNPATAQAFSGDIAYLLIRHAGAAIHQPSRSCLFLCGCPLACPISLHDTWINMV